MPSLMSALGNRRVQGVFFRANTAEQAERLDLAGWCRNTTSGTVEGEVQGSAEKVASMKVQAFQHRDMLNGFL